MKKYNLLIAENDEKYITNLMYYINQRFGDRFNTTCFTDHLEYEEYLNRTDNIDIILAGKDFLLENMTKYNRTVITFNEDTEKYKEFPCIRKYQSVDKICLEIIKIHEENLKNNSENQNKENIQIYTFYSPIGGIGTSTIAISFAYDLANCNNKVLYLNLENIQSTNLFFYESGQSKLSFSDLVTSVKNRNDDIINILKSAANEFNESKLYYFNSTESILDLEELTLEDIKILIENIEKCGLFDYVIVDIPSVPNTNYYYLLKKSQNVIMLMGQDKRSSYKIDSLLEQLDDTKNFLFVVNKFNKYKERLIPKIVAVDAKPVISTIDFYEEVDGNFNIRNIFDISIYKRKIDDLINDVIHNC